MITELYGLPGAGKTTMIKGITGGSATTLSKIGGIKGKIIQLLKKIAAYLPSSLRYKHKIKKIMKVHSVKPVYISTTINRHCDNIVMVAFGYKYMTKNCYMDEGLIHRIVSMAVNYQIDLKEVFEILDLFQESMRDVDVYYLDIPIEVCMDNIKKRNRHEYEMDEFDALVLKKFLKSYQYYFDEIAKKYNYPKISRKVNENTEEAYKLTRTGF